MELTLVPTDKMVDELMRRSDAVIFAQIRIRNDADQTMDFRHHGRFSDQIMLCELIKHRVLSQMDSGYTDKPRYEA